MIKDLINQAVTAIVPAPTDAVPVNILIVDDDYSQVQAIHRLISQRGIKVEPAGGAREALEKLDWADIVLLDWRLQDKDAQVVIDRWVDRKQDGPLAIISGYITPELRQKLLKEGAHIVLEKPVDLELMVRISVRWIEYIRREKELTQLKKDIYRLKTTGLLILILALASMLASQAGLSLADLW